MMNNGTLKTDAVKSEDKLRPVYVWKGWNSRGEREFLPFSKNAILSSILVGEEVLPLPKMGEWGREIEGSPFYGFSSNLRALVKGQITLTKQEEIQLDELDISLFSASSRVSIDRLKLWLDKYPEGCKSNASLVFEDGEDEMAFDVSINFKVIRTQNDKLYNVVLTLVEPLADEEGVNDRVRAIIAEMEL